MIGLKPFDPATVALVGALNPVAILVAYFMGRAADQRQKLIVAAFAGAFAGSIALWIATFVGFVPARGVGGEAGAFVVQFLLGLFWAWLGYRARPRPRRG